MVYFSAISTPLGEIGIVERDGIIISVLMDENEWEKLLGSPHVLNKATPLLKEAAKQLKEYFEGKRTEFTFPFQQSGTPFQEKVWKELMNIPFGQVRSYQEVAAAIGNPRAVRAVGQANKANSLPIIVPCHRVIGQNGKLVGYAGNQVDKKAFLLDLEKRVCSL